MDEELELKRITPDGVGAAIDRAKHYRLLGQPEHAESICLDVLEVEADNQEATVVLVLAMADQFGSRGVSKTEIRAHLDRLTDEYFRAYYTGIVAEREARSALTRGPGRVFAYDGFREAMEWFEKATDLRPSGNDDALLRWNACARTIQKEGLQPPPETPLDIGLE